MRLRWKLLILLLVIALTPLAFVSWLATRITRDLGARLAAQARDSLTALARSELQQVVDEQCALLRRDVEAIEFSLIVQARELVDSAPSGGPEGWIIPQSAAATGDPALANAPAYFRRELDGQRPLEVSFMCPLVWAAPERLADSDLLPAAAALLPQRPFLFLHTASRQPYLWRYATLDSGVQIRFPGCADLPVGFDPRNDEIYARAQSPGRVVWVAPHVDPFTGQDVFTCATPLRSELAGWFGVTAIDVALDEFMSRVRVPPQWTISAQLMIVQPIGQLEGDRPALRVLARRRPWSAPPLMPLAPLAPPTSSEPYLLSPSHDGFDALLRNMMSQQSGVRELAYGGGLALWGYSPILREGAYLLIIVPSGITVSRVESAETYILALTRQQLLYTAVIMVILITVVALVAVLASRSVTRPIRALTDAAARIASGDLDATADVASRDEVGELGRTFNRMVPQLRDNLKLRESLVLAQEVQQNLLPRDAPAPPGFDLAGRSLYCDQTGGDYFDFIPLDERASRYAVVVADVSGHGIAAALLMATVRALLRSLSQRVADIGELIATVNRQLIQGTPIDRFVTLYYCVLDVHAGSIEWVSAGHDAAIVYCPTGGCEDLGGDDLALTLDPSWKYRGHGPRPLAAGQLLLIGTDGIWECRNLAGEMFGKDRLRDLLRTCAARPAREIVDRVLADVSTFRGERPQQDDITLVVVKRAT